MKKTKICLQLFAEGAPTGEAASGATSGDGTETAETELATQTTAETGLATQNKADNDSQLATDAGNTENLDEEFSELVNGKYKGSYEKVLKQHLDQRLKGANAKNEEHDKLKAEYDKFKPVIERLKSRYGTDDAAALDIALEEDNLYIRDQAMNTGESEEEILANIRKNRQQKATEEAANEKRATEQAELQQLRQEKAMRELFDGWYTEAENLRATYPELNIQEELKDRDFLNKLVKGYTLEDAYVAKHHKEILAGAMSKTAEDVKKKTLESVAAGATRPAENGTSAQAPSETTIDVNSLTTKDILKIMKDVENGRVIKF